MSKPPPDASSDELLAERYGRTPTAARRTRWVVVASALAFVAVFAAWLVWGGLLAAPAQFEVRDTGHEILGDDAVRVTWEFTAEPGFEARCAVQALNSSFAVVGWRVVEVPASEQRTREFSHEVRTTERAVTGLIYRCWLT